MASEAAQIGEAPMVGGETRPNDRKRHLKERAIRELKSFVGIFVYLWVVLGVFVLHEQLVLAKHDIVFAVYGLAFVNALILAKVMLIAEDLHFARGLEDRPLALSILYRSIAFAILFICFYVLEEVIVGLVRGKTLSQSFPDIGDRSLKDMLAVSVIMFVALIPFFAYSELGRVIGEDQLHNILFQKRTVGKGIGGDRQSEA